MAERLNAQPTTDIAQLQTDADIYIYALCDAVLPQIAQAVDVHTEAIHLHTAGSMTLDVFKGKSHCGVLYPFQSFSKEHSVDFRHLPILTEASDEYTRKRVTELAQSLSDNIFVADGEARMRLHLAGVLANNFTNCLYALAEEQLRQANLPFELLLPLITETAQKVKNIPPRKAQTGPAIRHDHAVQQRHLELLDDNNLKTIYQILSKNIEDHET